MNSDEDSNNNATHHSTCAVTFSDEERRPQQAKGRKSKEIVKLLISYYHLYEGHWDEDNFRDLILKTGFNKKQLNKWFWDRKEKER
jgi:hypothetical protein